MAQTQELEQYEQNVERVRESGAHVVEGNLDLSLLNEGLMIRVSVHGEGILDSQLQFEELGFKSTDGEISEWMSPGQKTYAPRYSKRLHSWATQCRQSVSRYALKLESVQELMASRSWKFIFFSAWDMFQERWEELQAVREKIIDDYEKDYDYLLDVAKGFYYQQALESWRLIQSRYVENAAIQVPDGQVFDDQDEYLDWIADQVEAQFPSVEELREEVYAEYFVNVFFDPTTVAQAQVAEAEAQREQLAADREQWEEQTTRRARAEAIRQAELERARTQLSELTSPYQEAMEQLLSELASNIKALLSGYEQHGAFRGRSLDRLETMAEIYKVMGGDVLDDNELESKLNELRNRASQTPGNRDQWTDQIAEGLSEMQQLVSQDADKIARTINAQTRAGRLEL
jgi:DNA repair exonuclease SbcCD ATPase subunit